MEDAASFHKKLKQTKPPDQLNSEAVFVAILKTEKLPTDHLVQADALWVKCPKKKPVSALRKAFLKSHPLSEGIVLRHDFQVLNDATVVGSLNTRHDDLVVLEAVPPSQLVQRSATLGHVGDRRQPLKTITNELNPQDSLKSRQIDGAQYVKVEKKPSPLRLGSSHTQGPHSSRVELEHGWFDFACDRREELQRSPTGAPCYNLDADVVDQIDIAIKEKWLAFTEQQRRFYVDRSFKVKAVTPPFGSEYRGFWSHLYDAVFQVRGLTAQKAFEKALETWTAFPAIRAAYGQRNRLFLSKYPIPGMPHPGPGDMVNQGSLQRAIKAEVDVDSKSERTYFEPNDDVALKEDTEESQKIQRSFNILELFANATPEQLEKGVKKGVQILTSLRKTLDGHETEENQQWLQSVANVEKQAVQTKTIVGVVGATGAGKSSVINAMMDEERLVPTNCMRACTAVVTEISYNNDESVRYKAEIEFITREDWRKELETLFQDLFDGSGNVSRDCVNEDSDAGIAYAKIKAVYPKLTKDDMQNTTVDKLMAHDNVNCLGENRALEDDDSLKFYKKLQHFVDSNEKSGSKSGEKESKEKKKPREREYWPLIRVVRLYVKALALSTGAVIVDLPGVHDSNQARAAVAQGYLKQCSGLWIVAPITRAVDDKSAKSLLGESFKRQLKMDGGYSAVTFICSKTDDISLIEAQDSLGLEEELSGLWDKKDSLEKDKKAIEREISNLRDARADFTNAMEAADEELELWEKLKDDAEDGKTVYPPIKKSDSNKKRKRSTDKESQRKKSKYVDSDEDDFVDDDLQSSDHSDEVDDDEGKQDGREPLSESEITEKITELRDTKKEGRRERIKLDDEMKALRRKVEGMAAERDLIDADLSARCISGRNNYSRDAIRQDFAAGIRELDQELAEEEDAANFNPEIDARDYEQVAKSLPVFCVSSRAYQKLKGRHLKDKDVPGFNDVDETEIPKLQAHCQKLTEAGREASCRTFLNSLSQLLNSLGLWSSSDGTGRNLTQGQKKKEAEVLQQRLNKLDSGLEKAAKGIVAKFSDELENSIYELFPCAIATATNEANRTATGWGAPVNREDRAAGGLYWATYKAVVRRDGVYTNAQGLHNFNEYLTEPIIKQVAGGWEKAFSRRLPSVMNELPGSTSAMISDFHKQVEAGALRSGASMAAFQMLKQQLPVYKETIKDAATAARNDITTRQKDINREFVPQVATSMLPVYNDCTRESGPGQYMRMKRMMDRHVDDVKGQMFEQAVKSVKTLLKALLRDVRESLLAKLDAIYLCISRDYTSVVVGRDAASSSQQLPREQRMMRKDVLETLDCVEVVFKRVVGLEESDDSEDEEDKGKVMEKPEEGDDRLSVVGSEAGSNAEVGIPDTGDAEAVPSQTEETSVTAAGDEKRASSRFGESQSEVKAEETGDPAPAENDQPPALMEVSTNLATSTGITGSDLSGVASYPASVTPEESEQGDALGVSEVGSTASPGETEDVTLSTSALDAINPGTPGTDVDMDSEESFFCG